MADDTGDSPFVLKDEAHDDNNQDECEQLLRRTRLAADTLIADA